MRGEVGALEYEIADVGNNVWSIEIIINRLIHEKV